jgi:hypothetical protein
MYYMSTTDEGVVMKELHQSKKRLYVKPKVVSKRVEFMTNTFGTQAGIGFGPHREPPKQ